jgi:NAD(P)-dependent dehydrogenase (short-subunit alcohol dehydrogenase family)
MVLSATAYVLVVSPTLLLSESPFLMSTTLVSETAMLDAGLRGILAGAPRDSVMASIPVGRFGTPVDIARTAVFLASDDAAWITGVVLPVDGGMTAQ